MLCVRREWAEAGQLWVQQVSSTPCTRSDVVQLTDQLDALLGRRQARETGICPVRRELYGQCFGEDRLLGPGGDPRTLTGGSVHMSYTSYLLVLLDHQGSITHHNQPPVGPLGRLESYWALCSRIKQLPPYPDL